VRHHVLDGVDPEEGAAPAAGDEHHLLRGGELHLGSADQGAHEDHRDEIAADRDDRRGGPDGGTGGRHRRREDALHVAERDEEAPPGGANDGEILAIPQDVVRCGSRCAVSTEGVHRSSVSLENIVPLSVDAVHAE